MDICVDTHAPPKEPPQAIICYTAGLVDGEGSIQINPTKGSGGRYWLLTVQVSGNGESFLKNLRAEWSGIGSLTYWKPRGAKPNRVSCNWRFYSGTAEWFLRLLVPHLRVNKEQAEVALEFRKYVGSGPGSLTPEMKAKRTELAVRMRELNDRNGKATADPKMAVGVI